MTSLIMTLALLFSLSAKAETCIQHINKGDTISGHLASKKVLPLWGRNGSVQETAQLNNKNPHFIFPKEIWKMPPTYCNYVEKIIEKENVVAIAKEDQTQSTPITAGVEVEFIYSKIEGTNAGGTGSYVSDLGRKHSIFITLKHSHNWASKFSGSFQNINWDNVDEFPTINKTQQLWGAHAETRYRWTRFSSAFLFGADEQSFYKAKNTTHNSMEKISIIYSGASFDYELVNSRYWTMTPGVEAAFNLAASNQSYKLKSGYRYSPFIKNSFHLNSWALFSKLAYTNTHIKNKDVKFTLKQIGISIGLSKDF